MNCKFLLLLFFGLLLFGLSYGEIIDGETNQNAENAIMNVSLSISGRSYNFAAFSNGKLSAFFREQSSDIKDRHIAIQQNNYTLTFSLLDKIYLLPKKATKSGELANRVKTNALIDGMRVIYPNQFQQIGSSDAFANLTYTYEATRVKEELLIWNKSYIQTRFDSQCKDSDFDRVNLVFSETVRAYYENDNDEKTMGVFYGKDKIKFKDFGMSANQDITTTEEVYFTDAENSTVFKIPKLYAYDSNNSRILLNKTISMTAFGNLKIIILVPFSWLNASDRIYPVIIDPTIEQTINTLYYSNIAIDGNGVIYAVYRNYTGKFIRWCSNETGSWICKSSAVNKGRDISIAIDSNNNLVVATGEENYGLDFCNITNEEINCSLIDDVGFSGIYNSIAVDTNNKVHISHYDDSPNNLRYCNNTQGTWTCEAIDTANDVGSHSSIAIDSNNVVHISHYDLTNNDVRYCNNSLGSWSCGVAFDLTGLFSGTGTSIAVDNDNHVWIGFVEDYVPTICNNTLGYWDCDIITIPDETFANYISLAVDKDNVIHVTFEDSSSTGGGSPYYLRHCMKDGGSYNGWTCNNIQLTDSSRLGRPRGRMLAIKQGCLSDSSLFSNNVNVVFINGTNSFFYEYSFNNTDNTPPIISAHNLTYEYPTNVSVLFNFTDNIATDTMSINDTTNFQMNKTGFLWNITDLSPAVYWLKITANDTSNNTAIDIIYIDITDNTPPQITAGNITVDHPADTQVDVNATDNYAVDSFYLNTTLFNISNTGFLTNATDLSIATYWITIFVNDTQNNTATDVIYVTVNNNTDNTPPTISAHNLTYEYPNNVSILFNFTDNVATDTMTINDTANFQMNKTGFLWNITDLSPAVYWLKITANDTSNNTATDIINITITSAAGGSFNLTIISPKNKTYTDSRTIHFNLTSNESLDTCLISFDSWNTNFTMTISADNLTANYTNSFTSASISDIIFNHTEFWCNNTKGIINNTQSINFSINDYELPDQSGGGSDNGGGDGTQTTLPSTISSTTSTIYQEGEEPPEDYPPGMNGKAFDANGDGDYTDPLDDYDGDGVLNMYDPSWYGTKEQQKESAADGGGSGGGGIEYILIQPSGYCGDGVCGYNETHDSCRYDCEEIIIFVNPVLIYSSIDPGEYKDVEIAVTSLTNQTITLTGEFKQEKNDNSYLWAGFVDANNNTQQNITVQIQPNHIVKITVRTAVPNSTRAGNYLFAIDFKAREAIKRAIYRTSVGKPLWIKNIEGFLGYCWVEVNLRSLKCITTGFLLLLLSIVGSMIILYIKFVKGNPRIQKYYRRQS